MISAHVMMNDEHIALRTDLYFCKFDLVSRRNAFARAAGLYFFILEGICIGLWGLLLPTLQSKLPLSDSKLGAAAFCTYFGTIIGTVCAAYLINCLGMRRTALFSSLGFSIALALLATFDNYFALLCFMLIFGILWGIVDVTANNATVLAEIVGGASYIGTCYGSFSLTAGCLSAVEPAIASNITTTLVTLTIITMVCNVIFAAMIYDQMQESYILKFNREKHADQKRGCSNLGVDAYTPLEQDIYNCITRVANPTTIKLSVHKHLIDCDESLATQDCADRQTLAQEHAVRKQTQLQYSSLALGEDESKTSENKYWSVCRYLFGLPVLHQPRAIYILGAVWFLGTFSEACMITWNVIYYKDVLHASKSNKAVGFGCLFVSMAVGRFSCDFLRGRYGNKMVIFGSGLLVATGLWMIFALSFVKHSVVLTSLGVTLMGLGVSTLNPIAFSTAGHLTQAQYDVEGISSESITSDTSDTCTDPHTGSMHTNSQSGSGNGSAVATVAMCAYCGSILSSPLVGLFSDLSGSLRYGFLFVAVVASGIVPLSLWVPEK